MKHVQLPKGTSGWHEILNWANSCRWCSVAKSRPTLCNPVECSMPGPPSFNISRGRLQLMSIESVMPSKHLVLCHPLLLPSLFPSIRVFSSESALGFRWPKFWSFGFSNSPSDEYLELISFRINWFDLLAVQGTLTCLLQIPQFKSISCLALSLLYGLTLTTIHDAGKNHSFDYMDLCQQNDVSSF